MKKIIELSLLPQEADNKKIIDERISRQKHLGRITGFRINKKSIDARRNPIKVNLQVEVFIDEEISSLRFIQHQFKEVSKNKSVVIIGAGPSGLFTALRLLEEGIKPILIEQGKNVKERRRDIANINKKQIINPNSNYCFGEGGAGTYSDGKLYTRSNKRGDTKKVLELFVQHGADETILIEAHPHIGTNKLPKIIEQIRNTILNHGGEIHFNTLLTDIEIINDKVESITAKDVESGEVKNFATEILVLATGHSARDIYILLQQKKVVLEAKPFAMGVRVEHQQSLIDKIQYHCNDLKAVEKIREHLPAAAYSLVQQVEGRGVYSFCMCPGGIIAPCATEQNQIVVNGWSPSKRNNPYANSGMVVSIEPTDYNEFKNQGALAGMYYQQQLEQTCWLAGGETQVAPAQRLQDFVNGKISSLLSDCSYQPGIKSSALNELFPSSISKRLREGFKHFGKKMNGYLSNDAVVVAVESRTSSPVRIPRNPDTYEHVTVSGLYPIAEGAGYAGGIMSAAMDGQQCASKIIEKILSK
ncbi:FAD-dependent dehydrogenase [Bacteroidota bacterium]|nr:FAD-dependent dehydrogenase [Bacteroidota bacterium]